MVTVSSYICRVRKCNTMITINDTFVLTKREYGIRKDNQHAKVYYGHKSLLAECFSSIKLVSDYTLQGKHI